MKGTGDTGDKLEVKFRPLLYPSTSIYPTSSSHTQMAARGGRVGKRPSTNLLHRQFSSHARSRHVGAVINKLLLKRSKLHRGVAHQPTSSILGPIVAGGETRNSKTNLSRCGFARSRVSCEPAVTSILHVQRREPSHGRILP